MSPAEADAIAAKLSKYTGLSIAYLKEANLRVSPSRFRKELLRDERRTVGRYDGRFEGIDSDAAGENPETDASDTAISGAFTAAFNDYIERELHYTSDVPYRVSANCDPRLGLEAQGAGRSSGRCRCRSCRRRSRRRDARESASEGAVGERLVRSGHAVLRDRIRSGAYAASTRNCAAT